MNEEKITVLIFVPMSNESINVFATINKIIPQLGYLQCKTSGNMATITYNGLLPRKYKDEVVNMAEEDKFTILFVETEKESPYFETDTVSVPVKSDN